MGHRIQTVTLLLDHNQSIPQQADCKEEITPQNKDPICSNNLHRIIVIITLERIEAAAIGVLNMSWQNLRPICCCC